MARLNGTLTVILTTPLASEDGRRRYEAGETVIIAIHAGSDVRVWGERGDYGLSAAGPRR